MAKVIILSGAGISAESGISTFRSEDGLWNNHRIEDVCMQGCLNTNREMTLNFYDDLRISLKDKEPNHAHKMVAKIKDKYPNDIAIITQNVDNLFEKGGCEDVIHLHGYLTQIYCEDCGYLEDIGYQKQEDVYKTCPKCGKNKLRPNIVFFHEPAPMYQKLYEEFDDCEMFVVIGTSGYVINTDRFLNPDIKISILNNLEPSDAIMDELYTKALFKPATEAIDEIVFDIEEFLKGK
jgi:NAD-dependent deacetylase